MIKSFSKIGGVPLLTTLKNYEPASTIYNRGGPKSSQRAKGGLQTNFNWPLASVISGPPASMLPDGGSSTVKL